jgi:hypothetical protein
MLVMVEVPTWGCCLPSGYTYPDSLFLRLDTCMREMIEVGYNHPAIIGWGVYNEPPTAYNAPQQIPSEDTIAHHMDSTRYTYVADNNLTAGAGVYNDADIEGMNYGEIPSGITKRILSTEYHQGWIYVCYRGCAARSIAGLAQYSDDLSATSYAYQAWNDWNALWSTSRTNQLAGATLWAFNDYWSEHSGGVYPMGCVDHYRIPKAIFYLYRKYWTGVPDSVPVPGLTPTSLRLDADTNALIADSTDVSIITGSLRAADGRSVDNTNVGANTDTILVVFKVSGPANYFGSDTAKLFGGKCGFMIKSTNTAGPITITATALANGKEVTSNLPSAPITITSMAADTTPLPFLGTAVLPRHSASRSFAPPSIKQLRNSVVVSFSSKNAEGWNVRMVNITGDVVACPVSSVPAGLSISTKGLATGYYLLSVGNKAAGSVTRKIFVAR